MDGGSDSGGLGRPATINRPLAMDIVGKDFYENEANAPASLIPSFHVHTGGNQLYTASVDPVSI